MKNKFELLTIAHFLFIFSFTGMAQDSEYLLPLNTNITFNGYGIIEYKYGNLIDEGASFLTLKGGVVVNSKISFGLTAGAFLSEVRFDGIGTENEIASISPIMGYGGLFAEYIGFSTKKVHFAIPITLGPGLVALFEQKEIDENTEDEDLLEFSSFFVIEPGVNLEVNLLKEVKLFIGGSYRLVMASELDRLKNNELSDFMFNIGLKISSY